MPHKNIVQNDVHNKANDHGNHGIGRPAHVTNEWNQSGCKKLQSRSDCENSHIFGGHLQKIPFCSKESQNRIQLCQENNRQNNTDQYQEKECRRIALLLLLLPVLCTPDRITNGTCKAESGSDRLNQDGQRIPDRNGSKAGVPQTMSDEETIHNAVDTAKCKGKDRWNYEGIVFFFLSGRHFSQFSFTGCGCTLYRLSSP